MSSGMGAGPVRERTPGAPDLADPAGAGRAQEPRHDGRTRCDWATGPWLVPYHDEEWGVATHDDRHHFGHLVLEGAQAGLSWLTVLKRREAYRRAFQDFDPAAVARFGPAQIDRLLADPGIIRNRAKVESAVKNAAAFCRIQESDGSFDAWIWAFVTERAGRAPVVNRRRRMSDVPPTTPLSDALSAELRRRGFRFVGPVICYSHLQAAGLVNDHLLSCFRHAEVSGKPSHGAPRHLAPGEKEVARPPTRPSGAG